MRAVDADKLPVQKIYHVDEAGFGATYYMVDVEDIKAAPTITYADLVLHGRSEKTMTVKEKLLELVGRVQDCGCDVSDVVEMNYVENAVLVNYLIANGVTVKEEPNHDYMECLLLQHQPK